MQGMIQMTEHKSLLIIAANVRRIRQSYGWTQVDFAEVLNKPQSRISEIENARFPISTDIIDEICDALDVDQAALLTPVPEEPAKKTSA